MSPDLMPVLEKIADWLAAPVLVAVMMTNLTNFRDSRERLIDAFNRCIVEFYRLKPDTRSILWWYQQIFSITEKNIHDQITALQKLGHTKAAARIRSFCMTFREQLLANIRNASTDGPLPEAAW